PHRRKLGVLSGLLLLQVLLGALQPWPLAFVLDFGLVGRELPATIEGWLGVLPVEPRVALLVVVVAAGVLLSLLKQVASLYGTQVQVETGQRLVYDLPYRLFEDLQSL